MNETRSLRLRKDMLAELTPDEMRGLAGGDATLGPICQEIAYAIHAFVDRFILRTSACEDYQA